jgi:HD-GYP domain-containing protein (c-di-GMP phosphodiesterase class II)
VCSSDLQQIKNNKSFKVGIYDYEEEYPTMSGLAIFLGFTTTSAFKKYREDPAYTDVIDYAKLMIEHQYEKLLQQGVPTAKIALRRLNAEWEDNSTVSHSFTFADMVKRISEGQAT